MPGCLVGLVHGSIFLLITVFGFGVPFMVQFSTVVPTALVAMACSVVVVLIVNRLMGRKTGRAA